jgi:hypothetical protein
MAVKLVAREGRKDAKANSKGEGGVGPSGSLVPCPPPPATATSVDIDAQNWKNEEISVQVKSKCQMVLLTLMQTVETTHFKWECMQKIFLHIIRGY